MNQSDNFRESLDCSAIRNSHILQVVVWAVLRKNVAAGTSQNPPGVIGTLVIPEDGGHSGMCLFDSLVLRYELGKLRGRRTVEKFLVIDQSYSLQGDRISPNPLTVEHSLPSLREKFVSKFFGDLDRGDQSGVCPSADLIVCPNDNVGALRLLCSDWETVCDLFGRLDCDFDAKIVFESLQSAQERGLGRHPSRLKAGHWSTLTGSLGSGSEP